MAYSCRTHSIISRAIGFSIVAGSRLCLSKYVFIQNSVPSAPSIYRRTCRRTRKQPRGVGIRIYPHEEDRRELVELSSHFKHDPPVRLADLIFGEVIRKAANSFRKMAARRLG